MPRDGSGIMSKPAGTTAVPNTVIESSKYNATIDDIIQDLNAARPIVSGGTGGTSVATAIANLGAVSYGASQSLSTSQKAQAQKNITPAYVTKSGNYTAVADDTGVPIRFTAAATLSLTAAATVGSNFRLPVIADGGIVTIDPNASETVNGFTTFAIPKGTTAEIICDGSNFFVVMFPAMWKPVGQGLYTVSAASQLIVTDVGAYRKLRISGQLSHSTLSSLLMTVSTNNGSSYDTGTNYQYQTINAAGTAVAAGAGTSQTALVVAGVGGLDASVVYPFSCELEEFNQATFCCGVSRDGAAQSSARVIRNTSIFHNVSTARNAFRIFPSGGTFTGTITIEGVLG